MCESYLDQSCNCNANPLEKMKNLISKLTEASRAYYAEDRDIMS